MDYLGTLTAVALICMSLGFVRFMFFSGLRDTMELSSNCHQLMVSNCFFAALSPSPHCLLTAPLAVLIVAVADLIEVALPKIPLYSHDEFDVTGIVMQIEAISYDFASQASTAL